MILFTEHLRAQSLAAAAPGQPDRTVLVGDVVTMNSSRQIVKGGRVCIEGDSVAAVLKPNEALPPQFSSATIVDTQGTIYPGLIDLHNHLTYNMVPLWSVPRKYTNRNKWRTSEPLYDSGVKKPASLLADNPDKDYRRAIVRFAECRNLLGGVTTGQGMSLSTSSGFKKYFKGLMRNVESPLDSTWPAAGGQTLDYSPSQIAGELVPALAKNRPFFYHLSEGTDGPARQRFLDLKLPDGTWAINKWLICIHCVALKPDDFDQIKQAAGVVWSPTSNLLLYGQTAHVEAIKDRKIPLALGADWSPSGCKNLLGELKVARATSHHLNNLYSAQDLVEMVTVTPAKMIGWDAMIGSISPGLRADLIVLEGKSPDPYTALIDANESALRAILIDGRIRMGEAGNFTVGSPQTSEVFAIGSKHYLLDLTETEDDGLGGMSLATAISKLSFGLQHLPDLAASFQAKVQALSLAGGADDWRLDQDMGNDAPGVMAMSAALDPQIAPMRLDPITAVDDPTFATRMKANVNLPAYAKQAF